MHAAYGTLLSQSSYNSNGYGLYVKDVAVGETGHTYSKWSITIYGTDEKLPAEPPVSIEITQMPAKTTYKLGEDFDPNGLVVMGTDSVICCNGQHYAVYHARDIEPDPRLTGDQRTARICRLHFRGGEIIVEKM